MFLAIVTGCQHQQALAQAGSKSWEINFLAAPSGPLAIGGDGTLYACTSTQVFAVQPGGAIRWSLTLTNPVSAGVSVTLDGNVLVPLQDGRLLALSPGGLKRWEVLADSPILTPPAIGADGTILVGTKGGKLLAIGPNGLRRWEYKAGGEIHSAPVILQGGTVVFGARDRRVHAVSSSGTPLWTFAATNWVEAALAQSTDGAILVPGSDSTLYALNRDGSLKWKYLASSGFYASPAVALDGTIHLASFDGRVHALTPAGAFKWTNQIDGTLASPSVAVSADGTSYGLSTSGNLYAFSPTGATNWVFTSGSTNSFSAPTLGSDGTIYFVTDDGRLIAVRGSSGPATGAWPGMLRDARHSPAIVTERQIPPGYSAGAKLSVALSAVPPTTTLSYSVEESVPVGWIVTDISDGGSFESASRKIRFGPFVDGLPRALHYSITPPVNETDRERITGTTVLGGDQFATAGGQILDPILLHPADSAPADAWLTLAELTAYGAAWRQGAAWVMPPNPIPTAYLNKAIALWRGGETYAADTNVTGFPQSWQNIRPKTGQDRPAEPAISTTGNWGTATSIMGSTFKPGVESTVLLLVEPSTNVLVYAVEEQTPPDWQTTAISDGGVLDPNSGRIKWGPFFDHTSRRLTYRATGTTNQAVFAGWASMDGAVIAIGGQRNPVPEGSTSAPHPAVRKLPSAYALGATTEVTIDVQPSPSTFFQYLEETIPPGWTVVAVSDGGWFDPDTRTLRFGPFFDDAPRTVRYQVTPAPTDSVPRQFDGVYNSDGLESQIAGDAVLPPMLLHPADTGIVNARISLDELTAYAAAWKRGASWPQPPAEIPLDFVQKAISIWLGGELYAQDSQATNAPAWWVGAAANPLGIPATETSETLSTTSQGTIWSFAPPVTSEGSNVTISLVAQPATNVSVYAVEEILPPGWSLLGSNPAAVVDASSGKLKWGPFFDATPRVLSYTLHPGQDVPYRSELQGSGGFDGQLATVLGNRTLWLTNASARILASRKLPAAYSPGARMVVLIQTTPPAGSVYHLVQDVVPPGWTPSRISDGGTFDSASGRVKFGPFWDNAPRTLSYSVTPPVSAAGPALFTGTGWCDDSETPVVGDATLESVPTHPADFNPIDHWLTIGEITAYGAAWKAGTAWGTSAAPVAPDSLAKAIALWRGGENYELPSGVTNLVSGWVNPATTNDYSPEPTAVIRGSVAPNGSSAAPLPKFFINNLPVLISVTVTPLAGVTAYAAEDQPPPGWTFVSADNAGFWDAKRRKVKWGPFFDSQARTFSYVATPGPLAENAGYFRGGTAFNGAVGEHSGRRITYRRGAPVRPAFQVNAPTAFGTLDISWNGFPGETYLLQSSPDLLNWTTLNTVTVDTTNVIHFVDPAGTLTEPMKFYRAIWP